MLNISALTPSSFASNGTPDHGEVKTQKRKRNRKVLVCQLCHRHKQKCDRNLPCSRCVAAERPDQCTYETIAWTSQQEKQSASGSPRANDDDDERNGEFVPNGHDSLESQSQPPKGPSKGQGTMNYHHGRVRCSGATHWAQLVFQVRPY